MAISSRSLLSNILLLLLQPLFNARPASADEFIVPSNAVTDLSLHFDLGQTIQISWQTELEALTLLVSHWGGNPVGTLLSAEKNQGFLQWTIGEHDNVDEAAIEENSNFVLLIRDPSGVVTDGNGFVNGQLSSRAFVIKSNKTSFSTSSTSTTSSAPTVAPTTSAPAFSTPTPSERTSTGLSTAAKCGIGTGAGVAGLILIAAGIWLVLRWSRRLKKTSPPQYSSRYEVDGFTEPMSKADMYYKGHQQGRYPIMELPANATQTIVGVHEMGAGRER